jgi:hypothetical protein
VLKKVFKNIFTDYLTENGWVRVGPMSFRKAEGDIEIFFDTSHQIEIYNCAGRMKALYLNRLEDLIAVLGAIENRL